VRWRACATALLPASNSRRAAAARRGEALTEHALSGDFATRIAALAALRAVCERSVAHGAECAARSRYGMCVAGNPWKKAIFATAQRKKALAKACACAIFPPRFSSRGLIKGGVPQH